MEEMNFGEEIGMSFMEGEGSEDSTVYKLGPPASWDVTVSFSSSGESGEAGWKVWAHREVLKKAGYFESLFKEEWNVSLASSEYEIQLEPARNRQAFVNTLRLLYLPDLAPHFTSVKRALLLLEAAAAIMFEDYLTACTRFLECCPWKPKDLFDIQDTYANLSMPMSEEMQARCDISSDEWTENVNLSLNLILQQWMDRNEHLVDKKRKRTLDLRDVVNTWSKKRGTADGEGEDSPLAFQFGCNDGGRKLSSQERAVEAQVVSKFCNALAELQQPEQSQTRKHIIRWLGEAKTALDVLIEGRHVSGLFSALVALGDASSLAERYGEKLSLMSEDRHLDEKVRRVVETGLRAWTDFGVRLPLTTRTQLCKLWFPVASKLEICYREDTKFSTELVDRWPTLLATLPVEVQAQCCSQSVLDWLFIEEVTDAPPNGPIEAPRHVCSSLSSLWELSCLKSARAAFSSCG